MNIIGTLHAHASSENVNDIVLFGAITVMLQKWLNCYKNIPSLYLVAIIFYPKFKLEGLKSGLQTYYEFLRIENEINIGTIIDGVQKDLIDLFNDYISRYNLQSVGQYNSDHVPSSLSIGDRWLLLRNKKHKSNTTNNPELDNYLTVNFEFSAKSIVGKNFQVLNWWYRHQNIYHVLAIIAKEVLAAPVSTVVVEQAFSLGGNILEVRGSSLHPSTLEATTCVDNWTRADLR